jgi:Ger(x)C family germination protein
MKKLLAVLLLPMFITGCWDSVDIEKRGFVISMGIDKYSEDEDGGKNGDQEPRFTVTMAFPDVGALMGAGQSGENEFVRTAHAKTVAEAVKQMDAASSERLYFGHTRAVIFGKELLKDEELFREALDALERNRELSRNLIVLATSCDVEKALTAKGPGERLAGMYLSNFYRNNSGAATTFRLVLEDLTRELRSGGDTLIPTLSLEGEEENKRMKLDGAAVIRDFQLAGTLDGSQVRAFMWFNGNAEGALITVEYKGVNTALRVSSSRSDTSFYEANGSLICVIDIKARAEVEEFSFSGIQLNCDAALRELGAICGQSITDDIMRLFAVFRDDLETDGLGLRERLHKQNILLYTAYGDEAYSAMIPVVRVDIEITGAGVIK